MTLFKQRKNKQFNYTPRYPKDELSKTEGSLESHWQEVKVSNKRKRSIFTSLPFLIIFLITVMILLYILNHYETI